MHLRLAEYQAARERYEEARPIYAQIGHRYSVATTLAYLGLAYQGLGEMERARQSLLEAVRLYEEIGSPYAAWAREQLARLRGEAEDG